MTYNNEPHLAGTPDRVKDLGQARNGQVTGTEANGGSARADGGEVINIQETGFPGKDMFAADVLELDDKWYPVGTAGHTRPLLFDLSHGSWISLFKGKGSGTIQRHRHSAPVTGWTFEGAWGYRERDWVATAGSFVYEAAGDIHTLYIDPVVGHMTALFHVFGPLIYLDDAGNAVDYEDVFVRLDKYQKHCRAVGLGDDWVKSLIR
ncbi:MAG: 2,4'-dihydroxyacetophenone dioxygenase family protein [Lautropia sp.]